MTTVCTVSICFPVTEEKKAQEKQKENLQVFWCFLFGFCFFACVKKMSFTKCELLNRVRNHD